MTQNDKDKPVWKNRKCPICGIKQEKVKYQRVAYHIRNSHTWREWCELNDVYDSTLERRSDTPNNEPSSSNTELWSDVEQPDNFNESHG